MKTLQSINAMLFSSFLVGLLAIWWLPLPEPIRLPVTIGVSFGVSTCIFLTVTLLILAGTWLVVQVLQGIFSAFGVNALVYFAGSIVRFCGWVLWLFWRMVFFMPLVVFVTLTASSTLMAFAPQVLKNTVFEEVLIGHLQTWNFLRHPVTHIKVLDRHHHTLGALRVTPTQQGLQYVPALNLNGAASMTGDIPERMVTLLALQEDQRLLEYHQQPLTDTPSYGTCVLTRLRSGVISALVGSVKHSIQTVNLDFRGGSGLPQEFVQGLHVTDRFAISQSNELKGSLKDLPIGFLKSIPGHFRNLTRKFLEETLGLTVCSSLSIPHTAEFILRSANFGVGQLGVHSASWMYFGERNPAKLTLAQQALLIALVPRPADYLDQRDVLVDRATGLLNRAVSSKRIPLETHDVRAATQELKNWLSGEGKVPFGWEDQASDEFTEQKLKERVKYSPEIQQNHNVKCMLLKTAQEVSDVLAGTPLASGMSLVLHTSWVNAQVDLSGHVVDGVDSVDVVMDEKFNLLHLNASHCGRIGDNHQWVQSTARYDQPLLTASLIKPIVTAESLQKKWLQVPERIWMSRQLGVGNVYASRINIYSDVQTSLNYSDNVFFAELCRRLFSDEAKFKVFQEDMKDVGLDVQQSSTQDAFLFCVGLGRKQNTSFRDAFHAISTLSALLQGVFQEPRSLQSIQEGKLTIWKAQDNRVARYSRDVYLTMRELLFNVSLHNQKFNGSSRLFRYMKTGTFGDQHLSTDYSVFACGASGVCAYHYLGSGGDRRQKLDYSFSEKFGQVEQLLVKSRP